MSPSQNTTLETCYVHNYVICCSPSNEETSLARYVSRVIRYSFDKNFFTHSLPLGVSFIFFRHESPRTKFRGYFNFSVCAKFAFVKLTYGLLSVTDWVVSVKARARWVVTFYRNLHCDVIFRFQAVLISRPSRRTISLTRSRGSQCRLTIFLSFFCISQESPEIVRSQFQGKLEFFL